VLLGVISDVHCNLEAMQRATSELSGHVDEILLAGDAVYEYRFSNDVVAVARDHEMRYVLGNHEMVLLSPLGDRARMAPDVDQDLVAWVGARPTRIDVAIGGKRLCMVHGSPWEPYGDYLNASSPAFRRCDELDADILLLGHTHVPMVKRFGRTLVVNPGSLGESRELEFRGMVSYAIVDTDTEDVEIVRFPNPRLAA
jgi:putative phosphoesterase